MRQALLLAGLMFCGAACSSADPSASNAEVASTVSLKGETPVLPGFSYDTGPLPSSGPAQLSLGLSAGGKLSVEARAVPRGDALAGAPGGKLDLDMHVKLKGTLKVDTPVKKYDGELPGVKDLDIAIKGETAFDGLLLEGDPAKLTAEVPETRLPDVPLGSIPGHLELTVSKDSRVTSSYKGGCLTAEGGAATLRGQATIGGSLVLNGKIVLEIPGFSKSIDLPAVNVPLPDTTTSLDTAPATVQGLADATQGECPAATGSEGGSSGNGGGSGTTEEPPACKPINIDTYRGLECNYCLRETCCALDNACMKDEECKAMWNCTEACFDETCRLQCAAKHPTAIDAYSNMRTCRDSWCRAECGDY